MESSRMRARLGLALLGILALLGAACSSPSDGNGAAETPDETPPTGAEGSRLEELVAAAQEEGSLLIYSAQSEDVNQRVAAAFEETYGISTEMLRVRSQDAIQRIPAEADADSTVVDVSINNQLTVEAFTEMGLLVELDEDLVPALAEWPQEHFDGYAARFNVAPMVAAYNSELLPPDLLPESWEDLLDPGLAGQLILVDPISAPTFGAQVDLWAQEYGDEFIESLGAQDLQVYESSGPGNEALASGAGWINIITIDATLIPMREAGAPLELIELSPTTGVEQHVAMVTDAPHPNAAALFINWLLSEEGNSVFNGDEAASPLGTCCGLPMPADYRPLHEVTTDRLEELGALLGL